MTTKKRVIRRKDSEQGTFKFSADMIPDLSNGKPQPEFLTNYRGRAWEAYEKLGMPTTSEEPWRRTDIRRLDVSSFGIAQAGNDTPEIPAELLEPLAGDMNGGTITLSAAGATVSLDQEIAAKGVIFTDLKTAAIEHPEVLEKVLGELVKEDEDKFAALTAAFSQSGVLLYVPKGVKVELPLHSVMWVPGVGAAYFSHILIWIEDEASAKYVHEYASPTENGQVMHSGIVEMHIGKAADFKYVELQSLGLNVWNFMHERARVDRDGLLDWMFGAVGTHLTKNFTEINLIGEGAVGRMSGFYFTDGKQHLDHDTQQNHHAPSTTSDLLFKGALAGESRSVWQGMIYVAQDAQKTDGYQSNPNLVLSKTARADSIPGLEILADDVRCTHGATIGKIDPTEVFYLKSRGIGQRDAEQLIIEGFFDPIMQRIPFERVRERLQQAIVDKLN